MINAGRVLSNPRFAQTFMVYRKAGSYVAGRWTGTESPLSVQGVITMAGELDLEMLPEGDVQSGAIAVYSQTPLYLTNATGTSDEIMWRGSRWRVAKLLPYADYGYYKALAVKMDPSTEVTP